MSTAANATPTTHAFAECVSRLRAWERAWPAFCSICLDAFVMGTSVRMCDHI